MIYNNIGNSFKDLLKQYIENLENYASTEEEIKLIKGIKKLIKNKGVEL